MLVRLGMFCSVVVASGALACGAAGAEPARSADAFVDSIGMNVHFSSTRSPYVLQYDEMREALLGLGVRHLRDGAVHDQRWLDRLNDFGRRGVKTIYISAITDTPAYIRAFPARVPDSFEGFEGPNEYDSQANRNPDWAQSLIAFQRMLYTTVKSDPQIARFPVIAPSLTRGASFSVVGDLSQSSDFGNMHDYFGGHEPGNRGYGSNGYGSIDYNLRLASQITQSKPVIATETGYCQSAQPGGIPENVAAIYEPRMFLEQFSHGVFRTYQYELLDEGGDPNGIGSHCGLLRNDLTPKPAYGALKALIGYFSDPGPAFRPGSLEYSLQGNLDRVDHVLLEKRDGTMYLALWIERYVYDAAAKRDLDSPPQALTLRLARSARGVTAVRFGDDGTVRPTGVRVENDSVSLTIERNVTVIAIPRLAH